MIAQGRYVILEPTTNPTLNTESGLILSSGLKQYRIISIGSECGFPSTVKNGSFVILADENELVIPIKDGVVGTISDNVMAVTT